MAKSTAELVRELTSDVESATAANRYLEREVERLRDKTDVFQAELTVVRQENAVLRQRLDDHLKRVELWDTRRWGLVVAVALAVFGAAMSFASGLLLATLRTPTK